MQGARDRERFESRGNLELAADNDREVGEELSQRIG
jgi:hypothetical protein